MTLNSLPFEKVLGCQPKGLEIPEITKIAFSKSPKTLLKREFFPNWKQYYCLRLFDSFYVQGYQAMVMTPPRHNAPYLQDITPLIRHNASYYLSNRPQVSMVYRLINHAGCW